MSIIYFCTFLFPAPSFPSLLAAADPGNLEAAQSLLNPTPSVKFYNSIFSDSPQLSSSGPSEIRQTGCCKLHHTEGIHTKVRSCNSRHESHVWQCIIMWATVVKGSCGSSFWTFDIVKHRFYRFGGVLPRARHPRHWRAFKMEILGNCASIISICVAVRHLLFPTTHWVHIIAARCSPHAATVCFHNGPSVILAAKA